MAKLSVADWSLTAGDNSDVGGINISEGWASANINNSIREIMAQIAAFRDSSAFSSATIQGLVATRASFTSASAMRASIASASFTDMDASVARFTSASATRLNVSSASITEAAATYFKLGASSPMSGIADTGQMRTASATGLLPPVDQLKHHRGISKAWVKFSVSSASVTIDRHLNISTVSRHGVGDYTVTLTDALADGNYAVSGMARGVGTVFVAENADTPVRSATQLRIYIANVTGTLVDPSAASVIFYGDQ